MDDINKVPKINPITKSSKIKQKESRKKSNKKKKNSNQDKQNKKDFLDISSNYNQKEEKESNRNTEKNNLKISDSKWNIEQVSEHILTVTKLVYQIYKEIFPEKESSQTRLEFYYIAKKSLELSYENAEKKIQPLPEIVDTIIKKTYKTSLKKIDVAFNISTNVGQKEVTSEDFNILDINNKLKKSITQSFINQGKNLQNLLE